MNADNKRISYLRSSVLLTWKIFARRDDFRWGTFESAGYRQPKRSALRGFLCGPGGFARDMQKPGAFRRRMGRWASNGARTQISRKAARLAKKNSEARV